MLFSTLSLRFCRYHIERKKWAKRERKKLPSSYTFNRIGIIMYYAWNCVIWWLFICVSVRDSTLANVKPFCVVVALNFMTLWHHRERERERVERGRHLFVQFSTAFIPTRIRFFLSCMRFEYRSRMNLWANDKHNCVLCTEMSIQFASGLNWVRIYCIRVR